MAYAALVSLEHTIQQILDPARNSTSPREKHQIISLDKYVISFQAFLDDFPGEAKNLEVQIRDAATAAEDIIECFMLEPVRLRNGCIMWIYALMGIKSKFEYELNRVAQKMEAIAAEVVESKNSIVIKEEKLENFSNGSSSSSVAPVGKLDVVGFDDELLEIKDRLAGNSVKRLQYVAISGMGGIGKTTLARNAYEDQLIKEHFHIRAWVTISQDYRAREILSCLLDSMKEFNQEGYEGLRVDVMEDKIHKILCGRRYLIVMDDTWSTKVLDYVRKLFPNNGIGSRIMLTTRLSNVAAYADSSPYKMHFLDKKKSWDLLKQKIGRDLLPDKLEKIGREIAGRCGGLPLAVVVIAGILSSVSETPASWAEVARNMKKATSEDDRMGELVSLGYNHLPHRLRACLLYMGLLPEDYSIRVSLHIKLWIAEGFLKHPKDSSKSLEADAEEHLEDLVQRNLILVTGRKYNGKIKSCGLHDMVRETCIRMLREEKHLRHVTREEEAQWQYQTRYEQGRLSKRSVLHFGDHGKTLYPFERLRLLRVLHDPKFVNESRKMLKLYRLRHLCLQYILILPLPADIYDFHNLQSLIIESSIAVISLPSSIWKLRQLRHLKLSINGCLAAPDDATSALENLQTLKEVVFYETKAYLLRRAPNLVKLGLRYASHDYDCLNESLVCLRQLEELKMSFSSGHGYPKRFSPVFPSWLKEFTQKFGRASVGFLEAIGSLPNLEKLKLVDCIFDKATWEVRGGEFPQLKMLQLRRLDNITTFIVEDSSTALNMLSCLRIDRCNDLIELSDEIGGIETLRLIEVSHCGKGVCDWARRIEEEQQDYGNDTLHVRCIRPEPARP